MLLVSLEATAPQLSFLCCVEVWAELSQLNDKWPQICLTVKAWFCRFAFIIQLPTHRMGFAQRYWLTSPRWCLLQASFRDQTNVTQFISTPADTLRIGFRWFHDCFTEISVSFLRIVPYLRIDTERTAKFRLSFPASKNPKIWRDSICSRGKGKLSDPALHYIAFSLWLSRCHRVCFLAALCAAVGTTCRCDKG